MKVPMDGSIIYETPLCCFWIDKQGILYGISNNKPRSIENTKEHVKIIKAVLKNKKAYVLADFTRIGCLDAKSRDYIKKEAGNFCGAIAMISSSDIGKVAGAIYKILMPPWVPAEIFKNENDARAWLIGCKNQIKKVKNKEQFNFSVQQ